MTAGRPAKHPQTAFGKRLSLARKKAGLTQIAAAQKLGISQRMYAFWERRAASIPLEKIEVLCKILRTTPNYLFGNSVARKSQSSKSKSEHSPTKAKIK
jgi:transcriptional regulator with XRE-family HTH domain